MAVPSVRTLTRPSALVLTIVVIEFVSGFTQGFYEPLIPTFGTALGVDASRLTLFNVIPTAIAALVVPLLTRLGDSRGYRRILRIVIATVLLATVLIWFGTVLRSWPLVLLGRACNGPIAVWLPLHIALVHAKTHGRRATSAVSAVIATLTIGTVVGTATSGWVYSAVDSLPGTVAVVPPLVTVALLLVLFVMPEFVSGADRSLDLRGFALLAAAMTAAIGGFVVIVEGGIASVVGAVALVVAGGIGVLWYRHEARTAHPGIDVRVLFSRRLGPLYLAAVAFGAVFYGFLAPLATFLAADPAVGGYGYGFAPHQISVTQVLVLLFTVAAALALPALVARVGPKAGLVGGFALAVAGFVLWVVAAGTVAVLGLFVALVGFGLGLVSAAIPVIIPQRAPRGTHGVSTGPFNSARTLGGALGGGLFLSLLTVGAAPDGAITATGYTTVWLTSAGILALGLLAVATLLTGERAPADAPEQASVATAADVA